MPLKWRHVNVEASQYHRQLDGFCNSWIRLSPCGAIYQDGWSIWNYSSWKTKNQLSCKVYSEVAGEKKNGRQQRCIEVVITEYFQIIECLCCMFAHIHYYAVMMRTIASQITSITIVYPGADQGKHQSSASLACVPGNSPVIGEFPAQRASSAEMFPFDDVIMI